jgi:hypothetical protein
MFKKLALPILLGMAMLVPSAFGRDRDDRYEHRYRAGVRVYVGPTYYGNGYYDRWGYWHPYGHHYGYYDRWGYWHPYR